MIDAVFLCDTEWKIGGIRQCSEKLALHEGMVLTDLVLEKDALRDHSDSHYSLELTWIDQQLKVTAVIDSFKEGYLVILAQIKSGSDFIEWNNVYEHHLEWAKNHLLGLYHNEYFMIQQMNNQLVDAQRRLTRSNRQLEYALKENKAINEKLEEARVLAEKANLSKTHFLSNMSHDIRTPMNAIVGLTELMQHHLEEPDTMENYIVKLQASSHYLLDLINDILDLSKIENGSMKLKIEPMDMKYQIEQVMIIIRSQIIEKEQTLSVQNDCTETVRLMGDPVRFRQILMNLFSNAVKYTPKGGNIRFTIREIGQSEHRRRYQFVVEDSGIGMTPEFAKHIFEPFARAESSVGEIQGTGLGMAITKSIVDAMGGDIQVESAPGKGSRFCIKLSFDVCPEAEVSDRAEKGHGQSEDDHAENKISKDKARQSLCGMRFMCAEDNQLNAEILASMLELEGASCTIYENGELIAEAFEKVKPGDYAAILMDVQMPVVNGYEATQMVRNSQNPLGRTIPIIAMTANAFAEDVQRCLDAGMNAHIAKPIDMDALKEIMYRLNPMTAKHENQSVN